MQMLLFRIPREISVEHTQQTFPVVQRDCRGRGPKAIKNNMINGFPLSLSADVLRSFAFNCRYTLPGFLFFFDFALFLFLCQGFPLQHHTTNKIFFFFFFLILPSPTVWAALFWQTINTTHFSASDLVLFLSLYLRRLFFFIPVSAVIAIRSSSFIVQVFETT